jgi:hypothetical protein
MTNLTIKEQGPRFRPVQDILRDDRLKAKLTSLVDEAVNCKTKIQLQQEHIKQLREVSKKELDLDPKIFNFWVKSAYDNDYSSKKQSLEEMLALIENVVGLEDSGE